MSDDEEDSLHYHHNNRIKASEITKDDFFYFTHSHSEEDPSSELGWESREDSSREGADSGNDWAPKISVRHVAMMAQKRGMAKDTSHDSDGEESTASDVESDDEISPRDDRARRRARDVPSAEPTTESSEVRVKGQDGVNEVVDPNSGNRRTSPRFYIRSTGAYRDMGLGMRDFFAEQLEATTTRPQFDPLQLDDSSHQGA